MPTDYIGDFDDANLGRSHHSSTLSKKMAGLQVGTARPRWEVRLCGLAWFWSAVT